MITTTRRGENLIANSSPREGVKEGPTENWTKFTRPAHLGDALYLTAAAKSASRKFSSDDKTIE